MVPHNCLTPVHIRPLSVMLHLLVRADDCPSEVRFDKIAHSSLTDENIDSIFRGIDRSRFNVHSIRLSHELNADAPTEDRITKETYWPDSGPRTNFCPQSSTEYFISTRTR